MQKLSGLALLSVLVGGVLFAAPAVAAQHAKDATVSVPIQLAKTPGSGEVFVYLEIPRDPSKLGIPQVLDEVPLTTIVIKSSGSLKIDLPITRQVLAHTSSGLATYVFSAWFGDNRAVSQASVPVAPRPGNAAAALAGSMATIMFSPFEKVTPLSRPDPVMCRLVADGKEVERTNLIGQMQDSEGKGSHVKFVYKTSADSTFGVGASGSPAKNYTVSGSFTITNSMSGSGGVPEGAGFNGFLYGHFYRQLYEQQAAADPICGPHYVSKYVKAVGDAFTKPRNKTKTPKKDPYGRCGQDPHGDATMVSHGGTFDSDRAKATTYSAAATIYNLSVSGSTGYTSDIDINYTNNSNREEFVCGNSDMPNAPILWSNNSQGR